jgi:RNA polymerase sigma-70 factor (ECF subfamily)
VNVPPPRSELTPPPAGEVDALVDRAQEGDTAAFRQLFRANVERVHRLVYRLVGPSADVEDLVQAVFVEGFRSLPAFRGEALFSTWLGRIAVRVTMRAIRRRPPRMLPLEAAGDLPRGDPGPEQLVHDREGLARMDRLLAGLKPKRRTAFVLHVLEGHSMEEISAMVGASIAAVKVRVHDARRDLERGARRDPWFGDWLRRGRGEQRA